MRAFVRREDHFELVIEKALGNYLVFRRVCSSFYFFMVLNKDLLGFLQFIKNIFILVFLFRRVDFGTVRKCFNERA